MSRFAGRPASHDREAAKIALDRGCLRLAPPEYLHEHFGIASGPPLPYLAAYEIAVSDLDHLAHLVAAARLTLRALIDSIAVPPPPSIGGTIVFREHAG